MTRFRAMGALILLLVGAALVYGQEQVRHFNMIVLDRLELGTAVTMIFEGATNDAFETTLTVTDPTVDRTMTIPNIASDTFAFVGAANAFTGANVFSSTAVSIRRQVEIKAAGSETMVTNDGPKVMIATEAGVQTFTLPSAATGGLVFSFVAGNAGGEILITPIAGQDMIGTTLAAAGVEIDTADGAGIKNTAATNELGDYMTIVSDGGTRWYMIAQAGIWAAQ